MVLNYGIGSIKGNVIANYIASGEINYLLLEMMGKENHYPQLKHSPLVYVSANFAFSAHESIITDFKLPSTLSDDCMTAVFQIISKNLAIGIEPLEVKPDPYEGIIVRYRWLGRTVTIGIDNDLDSSVMIEKGDKYVIVEYVYYQTVNEIIDSVEV